MYKISNDTLCYATCAIGFFCLLTWHAWLVEDAFITFRTIDNFINGYGLTWNVSERVQAYTHPLWMFVLSLIYFITGEMCYSAMIFSITISVGGAIALAVRIAPTRYTGVAALLTLASSQAYIDYATSGLENPMTHLIVVSFYIKYLRTGNNYESPLVLALLASLGALNRMDTLLFFLPILCAKTIAKPRTRTVGYIALGFVPFLIWEIFSLIYYGFPFPNTAYAKLNTNIPRLEIMGRGMEYYLMSLTEDPILVTVIVFGIIAPFVLKSTKHALLSLGILLYAAYILFIGGGYMAGRFLTAPFFAALCISVSLAGSYSRWLSASLAVAVAAFSLNAITSHLDGRMLDQRDTFHQSTSLLNALLRQDGKPYPDHDWAERGRLARVSRGRPDTTGETRELYGSYAYIESPSGQIVTTWVAVGFSGFYAGPDVHIVDALAITDPLLARIPPYYTPDWISGHLQRIIPAGYIETAVHGSNLIRDDNLRVFYYHLSKITRGNYFDLDRLKTIVYMNLGLYDHLIDFNFYSNPTAIDILLNDVRIRPNNPLHRLKLAEMLYSTGKIDEGWQHLDTALHNNPNSYAIHMTAGSILYEYGQWVKACIVFLRASAISPDTMEPFLNLAGALIKSGELDEARSVYGHILEIDPENQAAMTMMRRIQLP